MFRRGIRYVIRTSGDEILNGFIKNETRESILLENRFDLSSQEIRKAAIVSYAPYSDRRAFDEIILGENRHCHNYMLSGSAFLLEGGKVTSHDPWFLLQNMDYAFNSHWALTSSFLTIFPFTIGVKTAYSIGSDSYLGGQAMMIGNPFGSNETPNLWGYTALARYTKGTSNRNFTLSGGLLAINRRLFPFSASGPPFINLDFVSVGYCNRLTKVVVLNLEGWYFPSGGSGVAGACVKLIASEYYAWSFGCYALMMNPFSTTLQGRSDLPVPYLALTRRFN